MLGWRRKKAVKNFQQLTHSKWFCRYLITFYLSITSYWVGEKICGVIFNLVLQNFSVCPIPECIKMVERTTPYKPNRGISPRSHATTTTTTIDGKVTIHTDWTIFAAFIILHCIYDRLNSWSNLLLFTVLLWRLLLTTEWKFWWHF